MEQPSPLGSGTRTGQEAMVDLSVIIVNYNVREFLEQALSSVFRARGDLEIEVYVVDNNSVDGSQELVLSQFPDVNLIENHANVGFGVANNMAISQSRGRYLLILNPDTIVQEDTLATLVRFMDARSEAGAVGCKILNPDGTFAPESRRAFPTPEVAFYRMSGLSRLFPGSERFGRYNLTFLPQDETCEVDALSGSCMMIRRAALLKAVTRESATTRSDLSELTPDRLFDEDFFMYGEDLDLCYRIQAAGWKIYYTPDTQIIHYKGESTRKGDLRYVKLFYGAMLLFAEKHFHGRSWLFRLAIRAAIMVRAAASALRRGARALAVPVVDFAIVYATVTAVAALRFDEPSEVLSTRFLLTTPMIYGLAASIGIRLAGGYARGRWRFRPVIVGIVVAFVTVATLSFFVKEIAFSRFVILASAMPSMILLMLWRIIANRKRKEPGRAIVVGDGLEAARLQTMISSQLQPPFSVVGYVEAGETDSGLDLPVDRLGSINQVRDIIRLRGIDEVIFAMAGLENRTVVTLMSALRDLPIEFKTFVESGSHVIGKARVDDLAVPIISTEQTIGTAGSGWIHRLCDRLTAASALAVLTVFRVAGKARRNEASSLASRQDALKRAVAGDFDLVGWLPEDRYRPPEEWGVQRGAVSVTDAIYTPQPRAEEVMRAWRMYLDNQSISLNVEITTRAIRRTLASSNE
ncbi:MAG: glycosyltransferase [Rhodothermia bacterium]|nr:glycosyltransferase [Rhodothermia bacterium]